MTEEKIILDAHSHSTLSFDAENEPREMIERAIELEMKVFALTEHLDVNLYYDDYHKYSVLIPRGNRVINDLKKEYRNEIKLIYGVELGQGFHEAEFSAKLLREFEFDYVLGSLHSLRGTEDFYYIKYAGLDYMGLMGRYFDEVLEMVSFGGIDALAHLTYPMRYIIGREGLPFDIRAFDEKIRRILEKLIENEIALEINTAGTRDPVYNRTDPDFHYLELYRELGGVLLTVGSDAHRVSDLGVGVIPATEKIRELGFEKLVYFEKREPQFINL